MLADNWPAWANRIARPKRNINERVVDLIGAGGGNRTRTRGLPSQDFKSCASASFATPADCELIQSTVDSRQFRVSVHSLQFSVQSTVGGLHMIDVDVWVRGQQDATTRRIEGVPEDAALWSDEDVKAATRANAARRLDRAKNPNGDAPQVSLRGFSWIVEPGGQRRPGAPGDAIGHRQRGTVLTSSEARATRDDRAAGLGRSKPSASARSHLTSSSVHRLPTDLARPVRRVITPEPSTDCRLP